MQGFIRTASRNIVQEAATPAELIDSLQAYTPPASIISLKLATPDQEQLRG